ncbi:hypothetical protein DXG03_007516 [Asterophora parasitica]|uniref:Uncharacterized protein n=1 Tax=Asterophora parasitica TaxID=117018 RepID=A0A9P7GCQ8_9AGAR|nr:hypothetical protein DXG03_007516 [Asterophora parasitica]
MARNVFFALVVLACSSLLVQDATAINLESRQSPCVEISNPSFNLLARSKANPASTDVIKVIDVHTVPRVGYSILSASTGTSAWSYNALVSYGFLPKSTSNPNLNTVSFSFVAGESPSFISTQFPPPPIPAYCFTDNVVNPTTGPKLLAGAGYPDRWALCSNSTASGRRDVVYYPQAGHPHYVLADCDEVYLERV